MAACTFFGHRECYSLDEQALIDAIEDLIRKGVGTFYVGNQGQFDSAVYACLKQLRNRHPHIRVFVFLRGEIGENHANPDVRMPVPKLLQAGVHRTVKLPLVANIKCVHTFAD